MQDLQHLPALVAWSAFGLAAVFDRALGDIPFAVAVNPTTNKAYVLTYAGNTMAVIDGATGGVQAGCGCRGRQRLQQVAIEFDRGQRAMPVEEREGQRALPRSDLHDAVPGLRVDRQQDLVDHAAVVQEVLAQVFLGAGRETGGIALRRPACSARPSSSSPRCWARSRPRSYSGCRAASTW